MKILDVYFVRHAESKENIKVQNFCMAVQRLKKCKLPTYKQLVKSIKLLNMEVDAEISTLGRRQLVDMCAILQENKFWDDLSADCYDTKIIFSPLRRARDTCFSIVPSHLHRICSEKEFLRETLPWEHIIPFGVINRIKLFETWLLSVDAKKIVIVGHSQYFKRLLNLNTLMRNCDVWKCSAVIDSSKGSVAWEQLQLAYRTELAEESLLSSLFSRSESSDEEIELEEQEEQIDDSPQEAQRRREQSQVGSELASNSSESEIFCRICQATQSEMPESKLIQPCRCTGSQSYVHLQCLNTWRATSAAAFLKCSVCNHEYRTERSYWMRLVSSEEAVFLLTVFSMLFVVISLGSVAQWTVERSSLLQEWLSFFYAVLEVPFPPSYCFHIARHSSNLWNILGDIQRNSGPDTASWEALWMRMAAYGQLLRSPTLYWHLFCQRAVLRAAHVVMLGTLLVGISSFALKLLKAVRVLLTQPVFNLAEQHHLLGAGMMLMANNAAVFKVFAVVGCAFALQELHLTLQKAARMANHWLGERILEMR